MNFKLKQKLAYASLCVGAAALMSSSVANAAAFTATQAFSLNIAAPVIISSAAGLNFGATYFALPGTAPVVDNAKTVITPAGVLTPTIGNSVGGLFMAISTTGKSGLTYTATAGAPSAVMVLTVDDNSGLVGAGNTAVTLAGPGTGTFRLDTFTETHTVGVLANPVVGANGTTWDATLSAAGALTAKFGATLTMENNGTYADGAYAGTVRIALDY